MITKDPDYYYHKYYYNPIHELTSMAKPIIDQPKVNDTKYNEIQDSGAVRESLGQHYTRHIPLEALCAAAASFEYGSKKYCDRNWEKGLPWQQMIDSLKRHIEDFERGHDRDDGENGSGLHQVCMITACAMMLATSVIRNIGVDDRLIKVNENALTAKQCTQWIQSELERSNISDFERDNNGN
jgi:hypothetical protein